MILMTMITPLLLSLTDDQGSADVSFVNPSGPIQTPNLDKLAAKATRYRLLKRVSE